MFRIKIQDTKPSAGGTGILSFDLRDILAAIGEPVRLSQWRCHDLRYTAEKDGKFVIPVPFSRVAVAIGPPRYVPRVLDASGLERLQGEMEHELKRLYGVAATVLGSRR